MDSENRELDAYTPDRRRDSRAYTDDADVAAVFDAQLDPPGLDTGSREMRKEEALEQGLDRDLMAGDAEVSFVDMTDANTVGQEVVGGAFQPPDQSSIDELARAVGIEYRDDEPLEFMRKIKERDAALNRWELDPASSEDWPRDI